MNVEQARIVLNGCTRTAFNDHAFGDQEKDWMLDGEIVATGYFGHGMASVTFASGEEFSASDAHKLKGCGQRNRIIRNDSVGEYATRF